MVRGVTRGVVAIEYGAAEHAEQKEAETDCVETSLDNIPQKMSA